MAKVQLKDLRKHYGKVEVLHGIDLDIEDGEFIVLVGPSGCGKSTCLRMIAGLEDITGGDVCIGGRVVNDLSPNQRDIAMVFQDYALYPHMTVSANIGFSLKYRGDSTEEIAAKVASAAELLGLAPLLDRKPKELSGGQRQRVAMGRAIVRQPSLYLFDEPLSNLDAKLRGKMRQEIKTLHRRHKVTTVYVTHDQVEAMTLADRVVVMNGGYAEQIGTPAEIYHSPRTVFVAEFIGAPKINMIPGVLGQDGEVVFETGLTLGKHVTNGEPGRSVLVGLRPEYVAIAPQDLGESSNKARVTLTEGLGHETIIYCDLAGTEVILRAASDTAVIADDQVTLTFDADRAIVFDAQTGLALT